MIRLEPEVEQVVPLHTHQSGITCCPCRYRPGVQTAGQPLGLAISLPQLNSTNSISLVFGSAVVDVVERFLQTSSPSGQRSASTSLCISGLLDTTIDHGRDSRSGSLFRGFEVSHSNLVYAGSQSVLGCSRGRTASTDIHVSSAFPDQGHPCAGTEDHLVQHSASAGDTGDRQAGPYLRRHVQGKRPSPWWKRRCRLQQLPTGRRSVGLSQGPQPRSKPASCREGILQSSAVCAGVTQGAC